MAMIPQHRTTQRSDASTFLPSIRFLHILYILLQKQSKKPKIFLFVVQIERRKPHSKLKDETYRRPPRAKKTPTTDRAWPLTLFRESRPTPPTSAGLLLFQRPTTPQKSASTNFCLYSSTGPTQLCTIATDQIEALMPVSKI